MVQHQNKIVRVLVLVQVLYLGTAVPRYLPLRVQPVVEWTVSVAGALHVYANYTYTKFSSRYQYYMTTTERYSGRSTSTAVQPQVSSERLRGGFAFR